MLKSLDARQSRRPGIVLLVVMAMLALFATVALSFVFYAEHEATSQGYYSASFNNARADVHPELLLSYYLSQVIYDTDNRYSAGRGHALGTNMYGYNPADLNLIPYSGLGRQRFDVKYSTLDPNLSMNHGSLWSRNNMMLINYQNFFGQPRDPERDASGNYVGGNVHWTYPDLNNMFLAAVTGSGDVIMPSFYRPWMGVNVTDPHDGWGNYMFLGPHPSYHTQFSSPDWDGAGHVRNLEFGPGTLLGARGHANNDSIWMDWGFPVLTAPNGKRFKPLFASLIVDMDGKLNLFVHGNIMNQGNPNNNPRVPVAHFSNEGWGWWEVNLAKLLNADGGRTLQKEITYGTEWTRLHQKSPIARYGADGKPDGPVSMPMNNSNLAGFSNAPPYYSQFDFGGWTGWKYFGANSQGTKYLYYPGDPYNPNYRDPKLDAGNARNKIQTFPDYPQYWDSGMGMTNHAAGYNPFQPGARDDKVAVAMSQIEALYRYAGTNAPALTSDLIAALPLNMQDPKIRWLSALRTADLDRPGLMAFNWKEMTKPGQPSDYAFDPTTKAPYPTISQHVTLPAPGSVAGEFTASGWRSKVYDQAATGAKLRVLLNRNLTPYPPTDQTKNSGLINMGQGNNAAQFAKAEKDRRDMAKELYDMLIKLTGARDPNKVPGLQPTSLEYQAARWLAQVAVNIVDYIDEDDYMTVWRWNTNIAVTDPTAFVIGTEMPRLLINEVYAQLDNDASEARLWDPTKKLHPALNYRLNFWIELHNPLKQATASLPRDNGAAVLQSPSQSNYRVVLTSMSNFRNDDGSFFKVPVIPADPKKALDPNPDGQIVSVWSDLPNGPRVVYPANVANPYLSQQDKAQGFYVMAPDPPRYNKQGDPNNNKAFLDINGNDRNPLIAVHSAKFKGLSWGVTARPLGQAKTATLPASPDMDNYGVYLQRLANPNIPFQNNPAAAGYNPFVTVDIFDNINTKNTSPAGQTPNNVLNVGLLFTNAGPHKGAAPPPPSTWNSVGRRQPYVNFQRAGQSPLPVVAKSKQPMHTFFRHNGRESTLAQVKSSDPNAPRYDPKETLTTPFWWPVHRDRQIVNPMELLNVSCYHPWEYTQKFGVPFGNDHRGPWDKQETLLYRLLESTQTPYYVTPGTTAGALGGRLTGKININTIWDKEILDALVDNPNLDAVDPNTRISGINALFKAFMDSRSPGVASQDASGNVSITGNPGATDDIDFASDGVMTPKALMNRPFKSLGVGYYQNPNAQHPNGLGMDNTIMRKLLDRNGQRILDQNKQPIGLFQQPDIVLQKGGVPQASLPQASLPQASLPQGSFVTGYPQGHYFRKNEILSKIFNNVTTRSNVFAVWLTVGFFEVVDETVQPVKLGQEIGRSENRHIRHRMFAVIDRSNLMTPDPARFNNFSTTTTSPAPAGKNSKVSLSTVSWNLSSNPPGLVNVNFRIRPGMQLKFIEGDAKKAETVTVLAVDYNLNQITANITKTHAQGTTVMPNLTALTVPTTPGPQNVPGSVLGNPGPQEGAFDPRQNTLVVPHFSIIQ
jgi:hypothetical protein